MTNSDDTYNTQISKMMNNPKRFVEVKGAPGQLVRGTIIPNFGGTTTVRIDKDRIHEYTRIGSDRRETFTPIRAIDHVGVYESSIGILLIIALAFFIVSILMLVSDSLRFQSWMLGFAIASVVFVILYFVIKYKYMVVYSPRNTVIVFFTKSPYPYRQFAITVLDIARELEFNLAGVRRKSKRRPSNPS